jgi:hypothetical protein
VAQEIESRPIPPEAQAAGGVRDRLVPLGCRPRSLDLTGPGRVVELKCPPQVKRRPTGRGGPEQSETLVIPTNLVDLPADGMALIFPPRGTIEIFFRFYQHLLGGRPLRSYDHKGIEWQTSAAILACLLLSLGTGRQPTRRTFEMRCWYFTGMARPEEWLVHLERRQKTNGAAQGSLPVGRAARICAAPLPARRPTRFPHSG